ncbi:MAG: hypothetical protein FWH18_10735 [Marinilabiliaceae bacterium]|nr:hypothetical protein [Marinilabiliaceae bacterium]
MKISSKTTTAQLFNRYEWLVDVVNRNGSLTFKDINQKWQNSNLNDRGSEMPKRTFHDHRDAIRDMFGIDIECNKRDRFKYYIENPEVLKNRGTRNKMLEILIEKNNI